MPIGEKEFRNDLQLSSVHIVPQLLDEDLALAYKLTEMFKNEDNDYLKPEFYDFIGHYLLNMLAAYEIARREILEEDRKMNVNM